MLRVIPKQSHNQDQLDVNATVADGISPELKDTHLAKPIKPINTAVKGEIEETFDEVEKLEPRPDLLEIHIALEVLKPNLSEVDYSVMDYFWQLEKTAMQHVDNSFRLIRLTCKCTFTITCSFDIWQLQSFKTLMTNNLTRSN